MSNRVSTNEPAPTEPPSPPRRQLSDRSGKGGGTAIVLILAAMGFLALVFWESLTTSSGYTSGFVLGSGFEVPDSFWTIIAFGVVFVCIIAILSGGSVRVGRGGVSASGSSRRGRR